MNQTRACHITFCRLYAGPSSSVPYWSLAHPTPSRILLRLGSVRCKHTAWITGADFEFSAAMMRSGRDACFSWRFTSHGREGEEVKGGRTGLVWWQGEGWFIPGLTFLACHSHRDAFMLSDSDFDENKKGRQRKWRVNFGYVLWAVKMRFICGAIDSRFLMIWAIEVLNLQIRQQYDPALVNYFI